MDKRKPVKTRWLGNNVFGPSVFTEEEANVVKAQFAEMETSLMIGWSAHFDRVRVALKLDPLWPLGSDRPKVWLVNPCAGFL